MHCWLSVLNVLQRKCFYQTLGQVVPPKRENWFTHLNYCLKSKLLLQFKLDINGCAQLVFQPRADG